MSFDAHVGANKFARTMVNRMKAESSTSLVLDFGSINEDYSLTTNTFPVRIPKSDYMVCRHLSGMNINVMGNGANFIGQIPVLKPGDRVLVAWVQNDVVVVDVIVPANSL